MKNTFVKITLALVMLLVMAVPTQTFAAEKQCNLNTATIIKNYDFSNILKQFNVKIDNAKLQEILKQLNVTIQKQNAPAPAPEKPAPAPAPAKPAPAPAPAPAKPVPAPAPAPEKPAPAPAPSANLGDYEQQVVNLVNKERAAAGLPALKVNTKLAGVAEKKAEDLRDKNYFDHQSPTYGSPFDMMRQFGISYSSAGENIAKGQKTPQAVMDGWMNSSGHRANILNSSYTEIGVGYVTGSNGMTYWVQMFIRP